MLWYWACRGIASRGRRDRPDLSPRQSVRAPAVSVLVRPTLASMLADPHISAEELAALEAAGLGEVGAKLLRRIEHDCQEIDRRDVKLKKLGFEIAHRRGHHREAGLHARRVHGRCHRPARPVHDRPCLPAVQLRRRPDCPSEGQVDTVRKIYAGPVHAITGEQIYPGLLRGGESGIPTTAIADHRLRELPVQVALRQDLELACVRLRDRRGRHAQYAQRRGGQHEWRPERLQGAQRQDDHSRGWPTDSRLRGRR
jgi:hypothetical protein